jgi:GNAT superfamily N-acetyltransferase
VTDVALYARGVATAVVAWEELARTSTDAAVRRLPGVTAAVFPHDPERTVYNNAVLKQDMTAAERTTALAALEDAYAEAGVTRFAAWVHESDHAMRTELEQHGYTLDSSTRAMGMPLADIRLPRPELELAEIDWESYLRTFGLPAGLLTHADRSAFHVRVAGFGGEAVATATAFDHGSDCGIYNVVTVAQFRRHGLATALTTLLLYEARDRGRRTASVQSTEIGERVYAAVGFRDFGRILEFVPA